MQGQAQGAHQISDSMDQLNEVTQQTADSIRETNFALEQLTKTARDLQDEIANVRIARHPQNALCEFAAYKSLLSFVSLSDSSIRTTPALSASSGEQSFGAADGLWPSSNRKLKRRAPLPQRLPLAAPISCRQNPAPR